MRDKRTPKDVCGEASWRIEKSCEKTAGSWGETGKWTGSTFFKAVVTFLICDTFAVTVFTLCGVPDFPGWKLKFMRDRCKSSFPRPLARSFSRGSLRFPK